MSGYCYIPGPGTHASVRTRQKQLCITSLPYTGPRSAPNCCPLPQAPPACPMGQLPCPPNSSLCPLPEQIVPNYNPTSALSTCNVTEGRLPLQSPMSRPTIQQPICVTNQRPRSGLRTARLRDKIIAHEPPQWHPRPQARLPCPPLPPQKLSMVPTAPLECSFYPRFKESSGRRH
jgi:hypothetical protein